MAEIQNIIELTFTEADGSAFAASALESANNAAESATNAFGYASAASDSAEESAESARLSNQFAVNAYDRASAALRAKEAAETSATNAATSETNASNSATSASESAATATTKANEASQSATAASNTLVSVINNKNQTQQYYIDAMSYANSAEGYADDAMNSAFQAGQSAQAASASATNASTSATNASQSATTAQTQAQNAMTHASNAQTFAGNAQTSATQAAASANTANDSANLAVEVAESIPEDYTDLSNTVSDLKTALSDFESYVNPYYADVTPMGNDFFFKSGMFSVSGGTATIDAVNPLTVTNTSSGIVRTNAIPIDTTQSNICLDVAENSRSSMGGALAFFNASGGYISQTNITMSNGKGFITTAIPTNAVTFRIFLNLYSAATYTFSLINVYYGTEQILEKSFFDVLNSNIGLLGKKWGAVGDSLTATTTLGVSANNYVNYVADSLGLNAVNLGVAGTGYMNDAGASKAFWQRYADIPADTDVLTVFGSLNDLDLAYNNIGTLNDSGTTTLYGCMNTFLQGVYSRNVGMRVGIILPTPWQWMNRRYPNEAPTLKTEQYINALIAFCQFNSLPMLNLFDESGMHPWDADFRTAYYKNADGTHPNSDGHYRFIYPKVKAFVSELLAK